MSDAQHFLKAFWTIHGRIWQVFNIRKDWVAYRLKGLCYQGRANGTGWITATKGNHPTPQLRWDRRRWKKVSRKINYISQIVTMTNASNRELDHSSVFLLRKRDGSTDASMQAVETLDPDTAHAFQQIRLDEAMTRFGKSAFPQRPNKESSVRPRRLSQVLDGCADPRISLD
jgi:hypothetical protein